MANYNISFMDNTTSLLGIVQGVGNESGGWFGGLLLLTVFILFYMVFSYNETEDVLLADTFICSILAGILWATGLISSMVLAFPVVLLVVAIIFKVWRNG